MKHKRRKIKLIGNEWHLYSLLAFSVVIIFISVTFFTGTPQVLGITLTALLDACLLASKDWKKMSSGIHFWIVMLSIAVFGCIVGYNLLMNVIQNRQLNKELR